MIVFDGHVHIYDCYDVDTFFSTAFINFSEEGEMLQADSSTTYFMLMAEATGVYYFKQLREMALESRGVTTSVRFEISDDAYALNVYHDDFPSMRLIIVAGRQLITKERLELLALMTDKDFEDGLDLSATVDAVVEAGGIPVCPWGAGKWMGQRGKVLETYLMNPAELFFVGDSGGRPSFWPRPSLFDGENVAARVLSGSDPLPLAGEEIKVGRFGGFIPQDCPQDLPATFLCHEFKKPETVISSYGRACSPVSFVKNQIALRLK
ncbi:hypothetical protein [Desulforhopalus sp. 52FAK]